VFGYANFFADNATTLLRAARAAARRPACAADRHLVHVPRHLVRGRRTRRRHGPESPVHAAPYLLLFPQLIGPITRYRDIADQLAARRVSADDFAWGIRRFVIGLAKKVLVANVVAGPADQIFGLPRINSTSSRLARIVQHAADLPTLPPLDMAIGLADVRFRFGELSMAIHRRDGSGFWRRWHMSLSTWFRDISTSRSVATPFAARVYLNLVIVFFPAASGTGRVGFRDLGLFHGMFWSSNARPGRERCDGGGRCVMPTSCWS
jgi:alginate O-acetyltransferase complex protein AlgI